MYDLTCKRCGAPIMEYRGAWAVSREDAQRVLDEIYARRPIKEAGTCK